MKYRHLKCEDVLDAIKNHLDECDVDELTDIIEKVSGAKVKAWNDASTYIDTNTSDYCGMFSECKDV